MQSAVLGPNGGPTFAVAWSPDGLQLTAGGSDQQIRFWPTDEEETVDRLCSQAGDPLTQEEWSTYLPDEPFEPPC